MTRKIAVEFVEMEAPRGDRFTLRDSHLNIHGDAVRLWTTLGTGAVTDSPECLAEKGYKIIARETREVEYERGADGAWSTRLHRIRAAAGRAGGVARWAGVEREKTVQVRVYASDAERLKAMPGTVAQAVRRLCGGVA